MLCVIHRMHVVTPRRGVAKRFQKGFTMNVYGIVTEQIISQLQAGNVPWRKPWTSKEPCNLISQKPYRGINTFLLSASGFPSPYWLTYDQATKLGGHVRQGEHSHLVVYWKSAKKNSIPRLASCQNRFCFAITASSICLRPKEYRTSSG